MLLCPLDRLGNWDSRRLGSLFKVKQQKWTRHQAFFQGSVPLILSGYVDVLKFRRNFWLLFSDPRREGGGKLMCQIAYWYLAFFLPTYVLSQVSEGLEAWNYISQNPLPAKFSYFRFHRWKEFADLGKEEKQQSLSRFISHLLLLPVPSFTPL